MPITHAASAQVRCQDPQGHCQSPAMPLPDARRAISGAPTGNQNASKHGRYSAASIAERRQLAELIKAMREMANLVD